MELYNLQTLSKVIWGIKGISNYDWLKEAGRRFCGLCTDSLPSGL